MANLRRNNTINVISGSYIAPGASYKINAYPAGAVATSSESGSFTVSVYAGHGFATNDYVMLGIDTTKVAKVTATAATTITYDSTLGTVANSVLINLGTDTGPVHPSFVQTGSGRAVIYSSPDTSVPITSPAPAVVICDSGGNYGYYYDSGTVIWELVRNSAGTPVGYYIQGSNSLLSSISNSSTDNSIVRWNSTSGQSIQAEYTSNTPTISDAGDITAPGTHSLGPTTVTSLTSSGTISGTAATVSSVTASGNVTAATLTISGASSLAAVTSTGAITQTGGGAVTLSGDITVKQIYGTVGTSLTTGAIGTFTNWGTSPSCSAMSGNSTRCRFTIQAGSGSPTSSASFVLTFAQAYASTPFAIVTLTATSGTAVAPKVVASQTTLTITVTVAPTASATYEFTVFVIG